MLHSRRNEGSAGDDRSKMEWKRLRKGTEIVRRAWQSKDLSVGSHLLFWHFFLAADDPAGWQSGVANLVEQSPIADAQSACRLLPIPMVVLQNL